MRAKWPKNWLQKNRFRGAKWFKRISKTLILRAKWLPNWFQNFISEAPTKGCVKPGVPKKNNETSLKKMRMKEEKEGKKGQTGKGKTKEKGRKIKENRKRGKEKIK